MKFKAITIVFALLLYFTESTLAETYRDIGPLDTYSDLVKKFPKAIFTKMNPAWAQSHDVMYQIKGQGMSGTIIVKFYDARPFWKEQLSQSNIADNNDWMKEMAEAPDDSITVAWIRWIPDIPFPVSRLIKKYGKPEKEDFNEEDYQPYKEWSKKGLQAFLTDDGKNVLRIDFSFTAAERRQAHKNKFGFVPPWLQEKKTKSK